MYIPPFLCGFIAGAIVTAMLIIAWAVWVTKRK